MLTSGVNHITLKVRDLWASDRYYGEILGLRLVGKRAGMLFYSAGGHHHDLALMQVGPNAASPVSHQTGLAHFCLNVVSEAALIALYRKCLDAGLVVSGGVSHVVMHSFYIQDPDGHTVEMGVDVPMEAWTDKLNAYAKDEHYRILGADKLSTGGSRI